MPSGTLVELAAETIFMPIVTGFRRALHASTFSSYTAAEERQAARRGQLARDCLARRTVTKRFYGTRPDMVR